MYFVFSKLLAIFIFPVTWVFVLLIFALATKSAARRKKFLWATFTVFYLFSNGALINLFADNWDIASTTVKKGEKYNCAILLGGFSGSDKNKNGYFNEGADRFIQAVELYKQGIVDHILVSGGNGSINKETFKEGTWAADELVKIGVPADAIIIENESRNTLENAEFSKKKLAPLTAVTPPYLLITSAYHMRRSLMIFKRYNIPVVAYPCNYIAGRHKYNFTDLFPQTEAFNNWSYYIKEVVGYIACSVKPIK